LYWRMYRMSFRFRSETEVDTSEAKRGSWSPGSVSLLGVGFVAYHLIEFSREALHGEQNASFYSARVREPNHLSM
jgi:hypothetical protein